MSLLAAFLDIVDPWRAVFPQQRTFQRAVRQALGSLVCLGRRWLSLPLAPCCWPPLSPSALSAARPMLRSPNGDETRVDLPVWT